MRSNTIVQSHKVRHFLPQDFQVVTWENVEKYFRLLLERPINSTEDLEQWFFDRSELNSVVTEDFHWRYVRMSVNSADKEASEAFQEFLNHFSPKIQPLFNQLNIKLLESPFLDSLDQGKYYIHLRSVRKQIQIFREENIPVLTELSLKSKQFGDIASNITVEVDGKELTLPQAAVYFEDLDRSIREKVYRKTAERRLQDSDKMDNLFDELLGLRNQIALNAGYKNYCDYRFDEIGRFDYTQVDCFQFHKSVANEIMPLLNKSHEIRKKALGLERLRPWDLTVDISGEAPIQPFKSVDELIEKSIDCLGRAHPFFGQCLKTMKEMGRVDLDSRKGKRPGGYNMDMPESGVPFVFMNAANSLKDMRVMMHECGHAVHAFLTQDLELMEFKRTPSEVAELAAMAMELISMDYWDSFFDNEKDLRRAKLIQVERMLDLLPWIATIDKFQHWIYINPKHSREERDAAWLAIFDEFSSDLVDWTGFEDYRGKFWHKQLHVFEMPFYYIEYGFAQLGALAIWKNYCEDPKKAVQDYMNALKLGYTKPIGELYEAAGICFDFSSEYIRDLAVFIKSKIEEFQG